MKLYLLYSGQAENKHLWWKFKDDSLFPHSKYTAHIPPTAPITNQEFKDRKGDRKGRARVHETACGEWGKTRGREGRLAARLAGEGKFIFVFWLTQV
jgi:hypothetical protein